MSAIPIDHVRGSTPYCLKFHEPCTNCGRCRSRYRPTGLCRRCLPSEKRPDPRYDAKRTPSELEVAWAAGIYEGEGSYWRGSRTVNIQVTQKDPELLYRMAEMFGGNVRPRSHRGTDANFIWTCHGDRARKFVDAIWPWLTHRRKVQLQDAFGIEVPA